MLYGRNGNWVRRERYPSDGNGIGWEMTVSCLPRVSSSLHKARIDLFGLPIGVDLSYNYCSQIYYPQALELKS